MPDIPLIIAVVLLGGILTLLLVLLRRPARVDLSVIDARLSTVEASHARIERALRDEMAQGRTESTTTGRALREEVGGSVARLGDSLLAGIGQVGESQNERLDSFARSQAGQLQEFATRLGAVSESNERRMEALRQSVEERLRALQEEIGRASCRERV